MNFTNNYIPEYVPENWKWYEWDGLMTYIDKLKYDSLIKDSDGHFQRTHVNNFEIIHKQPRGEKIDGDLLKKYKIVENPRLNF